MKRYEFEVRSYHPPEYKGSFYGIFQKERTRGNLSFQIIVEETAPPPELIKDIVLVSAATLSIVKHLYDFYKEIKGRKGKVYLTVHGKRYDLEAYDIEELKAQIYAEEAEQTENP